MNTERSKEVRTIGVLTSGGDAPGMNSAIRAVVRRGMSQGFRVKGIRRGYLGLLNEDIIDMDRKSVGHILQLGGTILETERCKEMYLEEYQQKAVEVCNKHGIDALVVIGGDGSFRGAQCLAGKGLNVVGIPATIDLDITCTDYTIGFDTAINTAMGAHDNIRDTASSHENCHMIEVMGRRAGYIALWCGLAGGADIVLIPERDDGDPQKITTKVSDYLAKGRNDIVVVNAEGVGDTVEIGREVADLCDLRVRTTVLSYIQRGGRPTCRDRVYASVMGAKAVDLLAEGKKNRVVAYRNDRFVDFDIYEALAMKKDIHDTEEYIYEILESLSL